MRNEVAMEEPVAPQPTISILEETEHVLIGAVQGSYALSEKLGVDRERASNMDSPQNIRMDLPALAKRLRALAIRLSSECDGQHDAVGNFQPNKSAGAQIGQVARG